MSLPPLLYIAADLIEDALLAAMLADPDLISHSLLAVTKIATGVKLASVA